MLHLVHHESNTHVRYIAIGTSFFGLIAQIESTHLPSGYSGYTVHLTK